MPLGRAATAFSVEPKAVITATGVYGELVREAQALEELLADDLRDPLRLRHRGQEVLRVRGLSLRERFRENPGQPLDATKVINTAPRYAKLVVAFFTDGLIERRGESLDVGFSRLRRAMSSMSCT